jgi:hypothetical protein
MSTNVITSTKTADYQISPGDSGIYFHNGGATQTVHFHLPQSPFSGLIYSFTVVTPELLVIVAHGNAIIVFETSKSAFNGTIASSEFGSSVTMYCKLVNSIPYWFITTFVGTWIFS